MDSRVSHVPPADCMWGPAGCPGQSGESTQGRGPAPHRALSGWYTAGHSRSGLSHLRWFLSHGCLMTGSLRSGHLYLFRERDMERGRGMGATSECFHSDKRGWRFRLSGTHANTYASYLLFLYVFLEKYFCLKEVGNNAEHTFMFKIQPSASCQHEICSCYDVQWWEECTQMRSSKAYE